MTDSIKIRARLENGHPLIKFIIDHPMETGRRKDKKTGATIPAHYIQEITCEHNRKVVLSANWGKGMAEYPYMSFLLISGKAGDKIKISWNDNKGGSDFKEAFIS